MWLVWSKDQVFELGGKAVSLLTQPPPLPVLFRACIRQSGQGVSSTTSLTLFCLPAHQREEPNDCYRNLGQADSDRDLRPQDKSYVELDEEGGVKPVREMRDFFIT